MLSTYRLHRQASARRLSLSLALTLASGLGLAVGSAGAATQSLQVQAAPNAQATRPVAITATGSVGVASTIAIYAELGGSGCAAQASDEAARGASLIDQRTVSGAFAFSAPFTPATPGTYSVCTFLDGSSPGMTEHQNQAFSLLVGAAPAATPSPSTQPPPAATVGPAARRCVVPALRRHSLGAAVRRLTAAGCKIGRVYRPSAATLRVARRRAGGKAPTLVVASQTPAEGSIHIAGYTVAVRLAVRPATARGKS